MTNIVAYIFTHLFGTKVGNALQSEVKSLVTAYVASNSSLSEDNAVAYVNGQIDNIVASVMKSVNIPSLYKSLVQEFVESLVDGVVSSVYNSLGVSSAVSA